MKAHQRFAQPQAKATATALSITPETAGAPSQSDPPRAAQQGHACAATAAGFVQP